MLTDDNLYLFGVGVYLFFNLQFSPISLIPQPQSFGKWKNELSKNCIILTKIMV
jgi:hypothetical protein